MKTALGNAALLLSLLLSPIQAQNIALDWWTIDGGGGTSTGGLFSVSGTIGQPDAGQLTGGNFTLSGAFWGMVALWQTPSLAALPGFAFRPGRAARRGRNHILVYRPLSVISGYMAPIQTQSLYPPNHGCATTRFRDINSASCLSTALNIPFLRFTLAFF